MDVMKADFWGSVTFVVLPPIVLLLMLWVFIGDKRLVTNGEIAIGKVTNVRSGRRGPVITYEFLDGSGRLITTTSQDNTRSLSLGMRVRVFFNPDNPQTDQIAICSSAYEVANAHQSRVVIEN